MKQPSPSHNFALVRDLFGHAGIVIKTRNHIDYVYGLFKGRECHRRDDEYFEEWFKEGDELPLLSHPTKGDIVLVMGIPVREITGDEAAAIMDRILKKMEEEEALP